MDQRLCVSLATGIDYVSHSLSAIMMRYIRFYNNPGAYDQRKDTLRFKEVMMKMMNGNGATMDI